ncbi:CAP domain-containing protein [Noviherbaspirillum sp.]|uniref:CAP domain-containing protein n=1 Tax=Noviherbaspirillum sp. TaxID=1926288 RepID=UPI002D7013E2|nr:CAP domain-containing protein [Noviherbaspirillum sp.]HZW22519.1 CAP domain-containing protein [Noviherbaspirillum sp.]
MERHKRSALAALLASLALAACGGGGGDNGGGGGVTTQNATAVAEPGAPVATGNTAADGVAWFNYRRQQAGVRTLVRAPMADAAAQLHSEYQKTHNVITHEQTPGTQGFTGETVGDRLTAAGYQFRSAYAYGEVLSSTSDTSGINAAEDLLAAIYHRFVILDPVFLQIGAGAATVRNGSTYFTTNFVADRLDAGLGAGRFITYPFSGQQRVPRNFFSDHEVPDPVPSRNEVGYPVSVHADITSVIEVQSFTIRPRGGNPLETQLLQNRASAGGTADPLTPPSVAAIVPLGVLSANTIYDVQFIGRVDGQAATREWSFTTQ